MLRVVLSHSRKDYSKAVMRTDAETFLRSLENAFRQCGGVPAALNVDNLKAAAIKADWYDPENNSKLAEFCRHYGAIVLPFDLVRELAAEVTESRVAFKQT